MKRTNVKGNTWILEGPQLVGLYQIDEKTCLLFDPGSTKLRPGIEAALQEAGLTPWGWCAPTCTTTTTRPPATSGTPTAPRPACPSWRRTSSGASRA